MNFKTFLTRLSSFTQPTRQNEAALLGAAAEINEPADITSLKNTGAALVAVIVIFLVWASVANIRAVSRTSGEVAPSGSVRVVQHLHGGAVSAIHVNDGALVAAGQTLATLDGGGLHEDLRIALHRQSILKAREERFRAFIEGRAPDFTSSRTDSATFEKSQSDTFQSMIAALEKERAVIISQRRQRMQALAGLNQELEIVARNAALVEELYTQRKPLVAKGYFPKATFLETERERNALAGEKIRLTRETEQAKAALREYDERLALQKSQARDEAYVTLDTLAEQLTQNQETVDKLHARIKNLTVTSPVKGFVKNLTVNSIGAVIAPGQAIAEIVPVDEELLVEIKIPPKDIGRIQLGQKVDVKFSAYDFSQFGSATGKIDYISAATFSGDGGGRYYRGRVRLFRNYVGSDPSRNLILPGMTVKADIVLGDRTLLAYLLTPMRKTAGEAFKEQ